MNTDIIQVRGIMSKGFGQISKFVMMNPLLSIGAKGVYGYFISYTGGGNNTAFPGRDKIVADLGVTKDTYYKYLNELLKAGLITVSQQNCAGSESRGFQHNVYTIEMYPEELIRLSSEEKGISQAFETVRDAGHISAAGYGNVPKEVMTNPDISIQAKGVYSYISSFSGTDFKASPSKDTAAYHMNVSSGSYQKYCLELENAGYVSRYQEKNGNRFGRIVFILNQKVSENGSPLSPTFTEVKKPDTMIQDSVNSYTVFSDSKKSDAEISDARNSDTNTTVSQYNMSQTKTVSKTTSRNSACAPETGLYAGRTIDGLEIKDFVEKETDWAHRSVIGFYSGNDAAVNLKLYRLTVDAFCEMLTAKDTMQLGGHLVPPESVLESVRQIVEECRGEHRLTGLVDSVIQAFIDASSKREISNVSGYLKTILWTKLSTSGIPGTMPVSAKSIRRRVQLTEF